MLPTIFVQCCLIDIPTACALVVSPGVAIKKPPARFYAQNSDSKAILARASLLVNEVKATSYPELRGADVRLKLFESESDYFRARFAVRQLLTGRKMRYIVFVNPRVFTRQVPEEGVRAIIAHELAHIVYFRRRKRIQLLGLARLASKGFTARFERWADLQAITRGYSKGLKEYRKWLYQNVPTKKLKEKKRNYFSPEEIDEITSSTRKHPELFDYWLKHVPRSLDEILAEKGGTEKR